MIREKSLYERTDKMMQKCNADVSKDLTIFE